MQCGWGTRRGRALTLNDVWNLRHPARGTRHYSTAVVLERTSTTVPQQQQQQHQQYVQYRTFCTAHQEEYIPKSRDATNVVYLMCELDSRMDQNLTSLGLVLPASIDEWIRTTTFHCPNPELEYRRTKHKQSFRIYIPGIAGKGCSQQQTAEGWGGAQGGGELRREKVVEVKLLLGRPASRNPD